MQVLGVDASLTCTGWAVLEYDRNEIDGMKSVDGEIDIFEPQKDYRPTLVDYGTITTDSDDRLCRRTSEHYFGIKKILTVYAPNVMAVEDQFSGHNPSVLKKLSQVRGMCMLLSEQYGIPFVLYAPATIKAMVAGNGRAKKEELITRVNSYFDEEFEDDNIADAISAALCYIIEPDRGRAI